MEDFSFGIVPIHLQTKQVLLVESIDHEWGLPKGHKESLDTSDEACALRELEEETGIANCKLVSGKSYEISYLISKNGSACRKTVRFFPGMIETLDTTPARGEILAASWFDYDTALATTRFEDVRMVIRAAYEELGLHN